METPLMQYLKDSTRSNHEGAESQPFQSALVNGTLAFDAYCDYLVQLHAIHASIERRLAENLKNELIGAVMKSEYYQVPFLDKDLKALNVSLANATTLDSVIKFVQSPLFDSNPESCLGVLYVLLGSKHGAKFIAHKVKEAYSLGDDGGYLYFNPYGENFRPLWQSFVASMNALPVSPSSREAILDGATLTFDIFGAVGADLWRAAAKVNA